jgi:hypothetical protein
MKLKALLTKEEWEKLPKDIKESYVEEGDGYTLDMDDSPLKSKLNEFRSSNKDLLKRKDELEQVAKRYEGIDPEKYQKAMEAMEQIDAMEDKDLLKAGKLDELIAKRTGTMQEEHSKALKALQGTLEKEAGAKKALQDKLKTTLIEATVAKSVGNVGSVRKSAYDDVIARAQRSFIVDDEGNLKPNGIFNGKGDPMTPDEWATKLLADAPHLFEPSQGGGAGGGSKGNAGGQQKGVIENNPQAIGSNLEAVAKGTMVVGAKTVQ